MRKGLRLAAIAALLSLPAAGCDCSGDTVKASPAELGLSRPNLSWGEVCNEADDHQVITVENKGRSTLTVTLSIEGPQAQFFSVADEQKTFSLSGASARQDVHVLHHSTGDERNKAHIATLVVTPSVGDPVEVPLRADVADVEGAPTILIGCADALPLCPAEGGASCCQATEATRTTSRSLSFGNTSVGEISILRANVTNTGCGALEVTGVRIDKLPGDTCESLTDENGDTFEQVELRNFEPFTLAGSTDPTQQKSREIEFAFSPEVRPCIVNRKFVVLTNDPNAPPDSEDNATTTATSGLLGGEAGQGVLVIHPNPLVFGSVKSHESKTLTVEVRNPSDSPGAVTVDSIELGEYKVNPKQSAPDLFTIVKINRGGAKAPGEEIPFGEPIVLAKGTFDPNSVDDKITLTVTYAPTRPGDHIAILQVNHPGAATKSTRGLLQGNSNPKIDIYPDAVTFGTADAAGCGGNGVACSALNCNSAFYCGTDDDCGIGARCLDGLCAGSSFEMSYCTPICGQTEKTVAICNGGVATLEIGAIRIEGADVGSPPPVDPQRKGPDGNDLQLFEITQNCVGESVEPGECCNETLVAHDTRQGGINTGTIVVESNDEGYAAEPRGGRTIPIRIDTKDLGSRQPVVPTMLAVTPEFPRMGDWVTFSADGSYAPYGDEVTYRWWLTKVDGSSAFKNLPREFKATDPNKDCPASVHAGDCFRFNPEGTALSLWPEHEKFKYYVKVEVTGSICAPDNWKSTTDGEAGIGSQDGT